LRLSLIVCAPPGAERSLQSEAVVELLPSKSPVTPAASELLKAIERELAYREWKECRKKSRRLNGSTPHFDNTGVIQGNDPNKSPVHAADTPDTATLRTIIYGPTPLGSPLDT
jgi:hypothetical protein